MPQRVRDLRDFLQETAKLLDTISRCQDVLFPASIRKTLQGAIEEVTARLRGQANEIRTSARDPAMRAAGLVGPQLALKLGSFESALVAFQQEAREDDLRDALDASATILGSLAGAIPGFGSFAQELVEFLLKELKKRLRFWRRR